MKGFIEVTQTDNVKTLVAVKEIKLIENHDRIVFIGLDLTCTKKQTLSGYILVNETYTEVLAKIAAAVE